MRFWGERGLGEYGIKGVLNQLLFGFPRLTGPARLLGRNSVSFPGTLNGKMQKLGKNKKLGKPMKNTSPILVGFSCEEPTNISEVNSEFSLIE